MTPGVLISFQIVAFSPFQVHFQEYSFTIVEWFPFGGCVYLGGHHQWTPVPALHRSIFGPNSGLNFLRWSKTHLQLGGEEYILCCGNQPSPKWDPGLTFAGEFQEGSYLGGLIFGFFLPKRAPKNHHFSDFQKHWHFYLVLRAMLLLGGGQTSRDLHPTALGPAAFLTGTTKDSHPELRSDTPAPVVQVNNQERVRVKVSPGVGVWVWFRPNQSIKLGMALDLVGQKKIYAKPKPCSLLEEHKPHTQSASDCISICAVYVCVQTHAWIYRHTVYTPYACICRHTVYKKHTYRL